MKSVSRRDSAFLAEMGIAPLWNLRQAPAGLVEEEVIAAPAPLAAEPAVQEPVAPET